MSFAVLSILTLQITVGIYPVAAQRDPLYPGHFTPQLLLDKHINTRAMDAFMIRRMIPGIGIHYTLVALVIERKTN